MGFKYGKSKSTGKTGWVQEGNLNESGNLSGNASATENWLITSRGNDQIYYKTAGNGDRYYIDKSDSTGATTTWNVEEAMTVAEWDTRSQVEEKQISLPEPSPPSPDMDGPAPPMAPAEKSFHVVVVYNPETNSWIPNKPIENVASSGIGNNNLRRRKRMTRRSRKERRRLSRKYRR